jgi:hypothetical protein
MFGLIKDIVVTLTRIPSKSVVMDVVIVDIPPKFGMLLSRSWVEKLKGTLQMDMSYATILVFGKQRRLYREKQLAYMVSIQNRPNNHHIYVADIDIEASFFYNDIYLEEEDKNELKFQGRKVNNCRKT